MAKAKTSKKKTTKRKGPKDKVLDILKELRLTTEPQIRKALKKAKETGESLKKLIVDKISKKELEENLDEEVKIGSSKTTLRKTLKSAGWLEEPAEETGTEKKESGRNLAKVLLDQGVITIDQLAEAFEEQAATGHSLSRALINVGIPVQKIADALATVETQQQTGTKNYDMRLNNILLEKHFITPAQLQKIESASKEYEGSLENFLLENQYVNENQLGFALAELYGMPFVDIEARTIDPSVVQLIPQTLIVENNAIPLSRTDKELEVAFSDPRGISTLDHFSKITGLTIKPMLAAKSKVTEAINKHVLSTFAETIPDISMEGISEELRDKVGIASVSSLVTSLIEGAANSRATDIHLDPSESGLRVRYRIDGMLHDVMNLPQGTASSVISRIKVMSNLDIIERRQAQDGHISMEIKDKTQDLRVATIPTNLGEKVSIRLMSEENVLTGLNQLGLEKSQHDQINDMVVKPYGMLLDSGPVGSGKTTTLYACLNKVNVLTKNVMTIEDPVEYKLRGTNQIQVDLKRNFDFATGLKGILRQDPDVIMVGEVRDNETAKIAVRAALTGVLVLSTLHADDAPGTISTLFNYQIPGFLISGALLGVVAQRLVRKICPACRVPYKPDKEIFAQLGVSEKKSDDVIFYRGTGCARCFHTGYLGRTGVFEVMVLNEELKDLIFRQTTKEVLRQVAKDTGMQSLKEAAYAKVKAGITTIEEMFRVVLV